MKGWISLFSKIWDEILIPFNQARTSARRFPFYTHWTLWLPKKPTDSYRYQKFSKRTRGNGSIWMSWESLETQMPVKSYVVSYWCVLSHMGPTLSLQHRQSYSHSMLSCDSVAHLFICFLPNLLIISNMTGFHSLCFCFSDYFLLETLPFINHNSSFPQLYLFILMKSAPRS